MCDGIEMKQYLSFQTAKFSYQLDKTNFSKLTITNKIWMSVCSGPLAMMRNKQKIKVEAK